MNLISEVKRAGLTIWIKPNGNLGVAPVERLTDDLRQRITDNRQTVIAALQTTHRVIDAAENDVSELIRLLNDYSLTPAEHREALAIALADPLMTLIRLRAIAHHPVITSTKTLHHEHERKSA